MILKVIPSVFFLLFLLSIPTTVGFAVVRLFRTWKASGVEPFPWRSRWYSALKRLSWAWVGELVVLVTFGLLAAFVNLNFIPGEECFVLLLLVAAGCAISGFVWPRRYSDGVERIRSGRRLSFGLLAFYLFFPVMAVYIGVNIVSGTGVRSGEDHREIVINADSYSWWRFRSAGSVGKKMVPPEATEIRFVLRPGLGLSFGAHAEMRCKVSKVDLLAFAKSRGYEFQGESIKRNVCKDGPQDCDFIHLVWAKYNPDLSRPVYRGSDNPNLMSDHLETPEWKVYFYSPLPYPKDFLAYNDRYATCGGYSFLYDVKTGYLYANWSSN